MKTAPIETLRNPDAPKPGDFVLFRPWDKSLEDVSYWRRYANTSRWFGMDRKDPNISEDIDCDESSLSSRIDDD